MATPDNIQLLAEQLLPAFIPKTPGTTELEFNFTLAGAKTYRVTFKNTGGAGKANWQFVGYTPVNPNV